MTTEEMKLALLKHFRYLNYPMVATECVMATPEGWHWSSFTADVLAIKEGLMVEIEIKQHPWEIKKDLETKAKKHAVYLNTKGWWHEKYVGLESEGMIRPHKFYFACPVTLENRKSHHAACLSDMPGPYGLILMYGVDNCWVQKRAKWLHRDLTHLEATKERMFLRLVKENIYLREELMEKSNGKELNKLSPNKRYRFKKNFYVEAGPLRYHAEKGEISTLEGPSIGYAHMHSSSDRRLILMSKKEAFSFLEEVEESKCNHS